MEKNYVVHCLCLRQQKNVIKHRSFNEAFETHSVQGFQKPRDDQKLTRLRNTSLLNCFYVAKIKYR